MGSFEDCVWGRLKLRERQAHYLINAVDHFDLLESKHCQLPKNERQIRSLSSLKDDDLKVLAWMRACQQKQHGSPPDGNDVWREVRRLLGAVPDQESDSAYLIATFFLEGSYSSQRK
jgi:hypothetical protein